MGVYVMDKYDEQIQRIRECPEESRMDLVEQLWREGEGLFGYCGVVLPGAFTRCGCLTQIRGSEHKFVVRNDWSIDHELTALIRADERIPKNPLDIDPAPEAGQLEVFAEWQRRIDREIRGILPCDS